MNEIKYVVEVVELDTLKVVERIGEAKGGMSQAKAERVMGGMDINLNHERFVTRIARLKP